MGVGVGDSERGIGWVWGRVWVWCVVHAGTAGAERVGNS